MDLLSARAKAGLTRQDAAYSLGVAIDTLYRWEKGLSGIPGRILPKIQSMYGLSDAEVLQMLGPEDKPFKKEANNG